MAYTAMIIMESLRDRFVAGIIDTPTQKKLLQEEGLTFEGALDIALSAESADNDLRNLKRSEDAHRSPQHLHAINNPCKHCDAWIHPRLFIGHDNNNNINPLPFGITWPGQTAASVRSHGGSGTLTVYKCHVHMAHGILSQITDCGLGSPVFIGPLLQPTKMLKIAVFLPLFVLTCATGIFFNKLKPPTNQIRFCVISDQPLRLQSQCVLCAKNQFAQTLESCTGLDTNTVNNLNITVLQGFCIIVECLEDESFSLQVDKSEGCLVGSTHYGDNVEDEWFIVFLLIQLTKEDPNLVVKVEDSDGEFLLIEVADHLPNWVDPETAVNRVYLYRGQLHLVPRTLLKEEVTVEEAIEAVRSQPDKTQASPKIQAGLQARIQEFPSKMYELHHRTHCYVPHAVASILKQDKSLISAAVQAFCHRDPQSMKVCQAMKYFPPETRVMTEVTFTRCLYAQLRHQDYTPSPTVGWKLPPLNSPDFVSHSLGMKLACGFELLAANGSPPSTEESPDDLCSGPRWDTFLAGLKDRNYFQGEIEGSRLHQYLMAEAKSYFANTMATPQLDVPMKVSDRVHRLLANLAHSYEELQRAENFLYPPDDDSWLTLSQEELEELLNKHYGTAVQPPESKAGEVITNTLKTFLAHSGEVEGAEVPAQTGPVSFDPDTFAETVKSMLDFLIPEDEDHASSSDMSGYSDEEENAEHLEERGDVPDPAMVQYMGQMDRELYGTTIGQSFEHQPKTSETQKEVQEDDIDNDDDEFRPVDINLTALKNILESYSSQQGLPGPVSNLFGMMGVPLPQDNESSP
ncbi:ECD [Cordylochernes scorpioides]|uniref:ECD n=1 Tax=Cordylochernes scorpioides TaxID=51811 RepID=A0ABY6LFR7_9ARAC|nr:ECD [Cordylochernes scorpioides]